MVKNGRKMLSFFFHFHFLFSYLCIRNKKTIISKRQEYENRIDENLGSWLGAAELEV